MKSESLLLAFSGVVLSAGLITSEIKTAAKPLSARYANKVLAAPTIPDNIPLNQIQVIGSHNSYKQPLDPPIYQLLYKRDSSLVKAIDYSHPGLSDQLNRGLLNLEIDVYADAQGGKYAHPKGLTWQDAAQVKSFDPAGLMQAPGFKVFHIQDIDFRSSCLTLDQCLQELKTWSDSHPKHMPVFITVNAKDDEISQPGFNVPEKFTSDVLDKLDQTILQNLGENKLLTPDKVRGKYKTLEAAVLNGKWPTVGATRGKFLFILDETGPKRAAYIRNHPSLKGRVLFANAETGTPEAAFLIMNEPVKDFAKIQELVKKGYLIRTRADADTKEARQNDKSKFEAACRSGAQIITTDYYIPSTHFKSVYQVSFAGDTFVRQNPLFKQK